MTVLLYVRRKGWPIESVTVELSHERVRAGDGDEKGATTELVRMYTVVKGALTAEQAERVRAIAKRCPVHRTLMSAPRIIEEMDVVP